MLDTTVDRPVDQSHFECNECSLESHLNRKALRFSLTQSIENNQCTSPSFKHKSTKGSILLCRSEPLIFGSTSIQVDVFSGRPVPRQIS